MERTDSILFGIAFYSYLTSFFLYILHIALKRQVLGKIATLIAAAGVLPHTVAFIFRWITQGHVPLANMYEYMGLMSWMVIIGLIIFIVRYRNPRIGVFIVPIAIILMVTASLLPSEVNKQLMPALQSTWLAIHVSMAALGSGAFLIAFSAGALYLLASEMENQPKNSKSLSKPEWNLFAVFWIGTPLLVMFILTLTGILPESMADTRNLHLLGSQGHAITLFTFGDPSNPLHWGRQAIGLGIGMIFGAIGWPITRKKLKIPDTGRAQRIFMSLCLALLISAIMVGFMIKSGWIQLTPRSYLKIFEFFGPVLFFSWFLTPLFFAVTNVSSKRWLGKIGVERSVLEEIAYSAVLIGYPLYTVGALFAGAIWAEQAWGTWWSWDPKEVGALIIWLFYTLFLHARYQKQWKGDRAAMLLVFGMMMVFISFFGNYFFGGLHSFEVT